MRETWTRAEWQSLLGGEPQASRKLMAGLHGHAARAARRRHLLPSERDRVYGASLILLLEHHGRRLRRLRAPASLDAYLSRLTEHVAASLAERGHRRVLLDCDISREEIFSELANRRCPEDSPAPPSRK